MLKYMEELSPGEASNIKKTIQDLFKQTCILQVKCDPVTLVQDLCQSQRIYSGVSFPAGSGADS